MSLRGCKLRLKRKKKRHPLLRPKPPPRLLASIVPQLASARSSQSEDGLVPPKLRSSEAGLVSPKLRSSGGGWDRDEWDVTVSEGATYRVFRERDTDAWFVDGVVD